MVLLQKRSNYRRTEQSWVKFKRTGLLDTLDDGEVNIETFGPTPLERLEKFKVWARRYLPGISGLVIVLATIVTTVTLEFKKGGKSATKAISKSKVIVKTVEGSPFVALAPSTEKVVEATQKGSAFLTDNLWLLVAIPIGLFQVDKYGRGNRRDRGNTS